MPPVASVYLQPGISATSSQRNAAGKTFDEVLAEQQGLNFSAHASQRVNQRGIALDGQGQARLAGAIDQAASKGSKTSLVLVDNNAFIVNVPNKTIVTAVDASAVRGNVFTNIDSTVIA